MTLRITNLSSIYFCWLNHRITKLLAWIKSILCLVIPSFLWLYDDLPFLWDGVLLLGLPDASWSFHVISRLSPDVLCSNAKKRPS